jgi:PAS domain S-box-containing protein
LKAPGTLPEARRYLILPANTVREGVRTLGAAGVIAIAYYLAARLGLALLAKPSDVAVFWPASGIAAGILIVWGRRALPALVIAVMVGTVAANLMSDRSLLTSLGEGFCNAGEAVLVAWLIERWFGRPFRFGDLRRVGGFLAAAGFATAASATGGAATLTLLHSSAPYWDVWGAWFLSDWVGIIVVAPLVIGLGEVWHKPASVEEWVEGVGVLTLTALVSYYAVSHRPESWLSFSPGAIVLPLLLWLTARCPPVIGIAGAFIASAAVILATTFGIGRFGDATVPIMERVKGAQAATAVVTVCTLVLIALFAQRKKAEEGLRESERRLARKSAALTRLHEVGSRLWRSRDLRQALEEILAGAIELLGADMGTIRILDTQRGVLKVEAHRGFKQKALDLIDRVPAAGDSLCGRALRAGERMVIEDVDTNDLFSPFRPLARAAGYRAMQTTPIMSHEGMPLGMLATHFRSAHKSSEQDLRLLDLYVRQAAEIIERHKAEDALRESEERLRLAQSKTGVGVWDWNLRTGAVTCTPELEAIFGLEPGTVRSYADFRGRVHPDEVEAIEANRKVALRNRITFRNEFRIIHSDGEVRWLLSSGGALYDEVTGEPVRVLGNSVDITERKLAELALAERNAQLALAGQAALVVGSYTYEFDLDRMTVSEGYAAMHGLPEGTTTTTRSQWRARVHPDDLAQLEALRIQIIAERQSEYNVDYRIVRGGEVRWIEARSIISYNRNGKPQRIVGVNIDVTNRKRTETLLRESEARYRALYEENPSMYFTVDPAGTVLSVNQFGAQALGYNDAELVGQTVFKVVHEEDREAAQQQLVRCTRNPSTTVKGEIRKVRRDGSVLWVRETSRAVQAPDGQTVVLIVCEDTTERKRAEALLKESKARLSDALSAGLVIAFEWDARTGRSRRSDNAERITGFAEGGRFIQQVHPEDRENFKAHMRGLSPDNPSYALTFRFVRPDGRQAWLEETAKGEFDSAGKLLRINGLTRDITERKELEDHKSTLISELDHRVKNVLATVLTVASRTQETSSSMGEFVAALEGRIKSMANTHELLSHRRWHGIPLAQLVRHELAPYITTSNARVDGPDVVLSAEAGQTLAMVFHELVTNAAKFGAISCEAGSVWVGWGFLRNGHAESWLCIEWEESGGPQVSPPTRSGFGASVVRELIPYELGGAVDLMYLPEGVRCKMQIPAHWLSADNDQRTLRSTI